MKKVSVKKIVILLISMFVIFGSNVVVYAKNSDSMNELILLNVVKTWTSIEDSSWERHANIKAAPGYQLYEAAIWNDSVRLYKFDSSYDSAKVNKDYREKFLVASYPIPGGRDSESASYYIGEAFKNIFSIMVKNSPAKHYGIKCTGHGSGPGYMFTSMIKPKDVQSFMTYATELLGRKIDFYDMSSNCNQGTVSMMNAFYPYFDYILASELSVGGYSQDNSNITKFMEVFDFNNYPSIFKENISLEKKLEKLVELKRKDWEYSKQNMIKKRTNQSVNLYKMDEYKPLMNHARDIFKEKNIQLQKYNNDLKTLLQSADDSQLMNEYNKLIVARKTNKDFFNWDKDIDALFIYNVNDIINFDKYDKNSTKNVPGKDDDNNEKQNNNDEYWQFENKLIESKHNYSNKSYDLKKYTKANAKYISIYFSKIQTEKDVDYVYILNKDKKVVEKYSGKKENIWINVPGDTAYIYLVSNDENTDYGYKVEKVAYHKESYEKGENNKGKDGEKDKDNTNEDWWQCEDTLIKSEYDNYNNCYKLKQYTKKGAQYVAIYFEELETKGQEDYIYILDKNQKVVKKYKGSMNNMWVTVPGDAAYIYIPTSNSNGKYNYVVKRVGYHK